MHLTSPGQVFAVDCRPTEDAQGSQPGAAAAASPLKLLQWNIERGYQLPGIVQELKRIDADVLSLQEVDVGCDRSEGADTGEIPRPLLLAPRSSYICSPTSDSLLPSDPLLKMMMPGRSGDS